MKLSQTQKLILAILIFAAAGFVLYKTFFSSSDVPAVAPANTQNATANYQEIVDTSLKMDSISIDSSLFSSPLFLGLTDFNSVGTKEAQGRPNPFAIIGSDNIGTVTNVATSSKK